MSLAKSSPSRTSMLGSSGKSLFRTSFGGGEDVRVLWGPKYCSSSVSMTHSGDWRTGCSGDDEITMMESSRRNDRFRFGGVRWAARMACVEGGKCSDNDI